MKKLQLLKIISLIVLSGCAGKEVIDIQTIDITNQKVNHREITFDNKKCNMTSKLLFTETIGKNQQGLICVTPDEFNKNFIRWQTECQD